MVQTSFWKKHFYDPIFNAFVVTKWAIFKALEGPKEKPQIGLKLGLFHLFVHPMYPQLLSQAYCGRRGQQRAVCHKEVKAHRECVERSPSFVHFDGVSGPLWPNKAVLGHKMCSFGRAPPHFAPRPAVRPVKFWLKTWIWQGHPLGCRMARSKKDTRRWDGVMAKMERHVLAYWLLAPSPQV